MAGFPANVLLIVTCIILALASVVYFFYSNRIAGLIIGAFIKLSLWSRDDPRVYVDIGSVHFSLIAGRLLVRDVRYHSSNQSIRIVKAQISWRWWVRSSVGVPLDKPEVLEDSPDSNSSQCRIHASLDGFEWFLYNRTASFDHILSQMTSVNPDNTEIRTENPGSTINSVPFSNKMRGDDPPRDRPFSTSETLLSAAEAPSFIGKVTKWLKNQLPDVDPKSLLPFSFDATKGAITMGNHTTENLLQAEFSRAQGTFGITQSRSKLDEYKQDLRITFVDAAISCVENPDFWISAQDVGRHVQETMTKNGNISQFLPQLSYFGFKRIWSLCRRNFPFFKQFGRRYVRPDKGPKRKERQRKLLEEASHVGADFSTLEYAISRKVLEAPVLDLVYYADVAGKVPEKSIPQSTREPTPTNIEFLDIGNGDLPPEWGVDLAITSGAIHYGPWTDRQRAQLQRVFFPQSYQNIQPSKQLEPGDQRYCTCMKLFFEFRDVTTVHIPFREASKNWLWDGLVDVPRSRKQREAASLQIRFSDRSSIKYLVPMIATQAGYTASLDVTLDSVAVTSSLNDIVILETKTCAISSNLPSPLRWDEERSWGFNISLDQPVLYLIRDHINMLNDLGKDWSSGPPNNFNTFVPTTYGVNLILSEFELNLYANDHNIIDRPLDERDNVLFTLKGHALNNTTFIPSNVFRPLSTTVDFKVNGPDIALSLTLPRWNTHALSETAIEHLREIGHISNFVLNGSYKYFSEVRPDCIDQLKLDIKLVSTVLKLFGWVVRHAMVLRENYFGGFTQYSTTQEYIYKKEKGISVGDPLELKYRPGMSNIFHLDLSLFIVGATAVLPASVMGYEGDHELRNVNYRNIDIGPCTVLKTPEIQLQLRLHDYLMDLSLNLDPLSVSMEESCPDRIFLKHQFLPSTSRVTVSDIGITANRLFGPHPHTAVYVCLWNIVVGKVQGELPTSELQRLMSVGKAFGHGFVDPFNAPAPEFIEVTDRDATFLKVVVNTVDLSLKTKSIVARLLLRQGICLQYNNVATKWSRKVNSISIPDIELQLLLVPSIRRHWLEIGRIQTSIFVDLYKAPKDWRLEAWEQKQFVISQDSLTHRFALTSGFADHTKATFGKNILYLQNIEAPSLSRSLEEKNGLGSRHSPPNPLFQRVVETDSEEEHLVSEIERDERLAASRPNISTVHLTKLEDGQSSSPLDESDETDSVESENTWSDFLEIGEDRFRTDPRIPYWFLCRKFDVVKSPTGPDRVLPAFGKVSSDFQSSLFKKFSQSIPSDQHSGSHFSNDFGSSYSLADDIERSFTRFDIKYFSVFATPLCSMLLKDLSEEYSYEEESPELQIDTLILEWISSSVECESLSTIDVQLHTFQVCLTQEIAEMGKLTPTPEGDYHGNYHMAFLNVGLEDIRTVVSLPSHTTAEGLPPVFSCGKLSIGDFTLSISYVTLPPVIHKQRFPILSPSLECNVKKLLAALTINKGHIAYDSLELILSPSVPEVLITLGEALKRTGKELLVFKTLSKSSSQRRKLLVFSILKHTNDVLLKDLLSSVQPAFFVQSGRPYHLRQDRDWKLLFYLRHSLAEITYEQYEALKEDLKNMWDDEDILKSLETRFVPWVLEDKLPILEVELIRSLFLPKKETSDPMKRHNDRPMKSFSFQPDLTRLIINGKGNTSPSIVSASGVNLRCDLLSRRLIFELNTMAPHSSTNRCFKPTNERVNYGTQQLITDFNADSIQVSVFPGIIEFLQHAIHTSRILLPSNDISSEKPSQNSMSNTFFENRTLIGEAHVSVRHLLVEVAAENLVFEVSSRDLSSWNSATLTKPTNPPPEYDISLNHTASFGEFSVKARVRETNDSKRMEKDMLAGVTINTGAFGFSMQNHAPLGFVTRTNILLQSVEFAVPRSALRLYNFFEQWRRDYFHGVDAMIKSLFAEIKQNPPQTPRKSQPAAPKQDIVFDFNLSVTKFAVMLQVMHGTWLSWRVQDLVAYMKNKGNDLRACGLQIGSQQIRIAAAKAKNQELRESTIVVELPPVTATGSVSPKRNSLLLLVGFLHVTIKPSHWDALLSVQQKFGQDFNDLLLILGDTRNNRSGNSVGRKTMKSDKTTPFVVTAKFEGFKIGLDGLTSTQYLECTDIDAVISNKPSPYWQFTLRDLALYLTTGSSVKQGRSKPDYRQIPMYITIDLHVISRSPFLDRSFGRLEVNITKFHAVLQAHLIGDIGDFADYLQSELLLRREQRAAELVEFKEKARKLMKTLNVNPRKATLERQSKLLDSYTVAFTMANFGAAFPLDLLERAPPRSPDMLNDHATKAFLLTIRLVEFESQRGESGLANMKDFCFQFVPRFNPSNQDDFSSRRHSTLNQMLYPEMTARVRTVTTSSSRHISTSADISGFILDLDPSITAYTFSLIDAYYYGKRNVERFAMGLPRPVLSNEPTIPIPETNTPNQINKLSTSVDASLKFKSGTVRMHTMSDSKMYPSPSKWSGKIYRNLNSDAEIFSLPELTLLAEYKANACPARSADKTLPVLIFRSTVHSSHNTLRPSLLLFVSSIMHNVEERMKRSPHSAFLAPPSKVRQSVSGLSLESSETSISKPIEQNLFNLLLFISLRIDKSKLELTCKPDVNVVAGVNWESGGFVLNMGPEGNGATISASIEGLTIGLKHGFLSEDSAHIDARNLNFSVNFSKPALESGNLVNFVSIVVDTEFSGRIRFSRLQDFLCFKAVWLDRIPVFSGEPEAVISPSSKLSASSTSEQSSKQGFDTAVVVRIRRISLEADMGQSISIVTFELLKAVVRLRLTSTYSELAFLFDNVDVQARGNLSGYLRMPDFMFRTMRRRQGPHVDNQPFSRMLELNLKSGTLDIQLQSDWLWLLQYRAEPLEARIYDQWTLTSHSESNEDRQLQLFSEISGSKVIAMMTIMAIPKLMMYAAKFRVNLEAQKEGASRESSAFRSTRLPKPDNALSEVANAMLHTARMKLKETETLSYIIGQRMSLKLSELVFVVLPRSQGDNELARFIGKDVTAKLERTVRQDGLPAHRDLQLSLSRISISQLLKQGFDPRLPGQEFDILTTSTRKFTGTENVIFSLPAMDMRMTTDEEVRNETRTLPYDFISNFARTEGQKGEDINISFNISLYSWLTSLRKTLTKELKRAQEVSEGRGPISPQTTTFPRLTSPDIPLSLTDALKNELSQSPSEGLSYSYSPKKSSSGPSSPVTSRSMESLASAIPTRPATPTRSATSRPSLFLSSPKSELSESVKAINASLNPLPIQASTSSNESTDKAFAEPSLKKSQDIAYVVRTRKIERLTVKQLGEATPDVMHPFFTRKAGFNLEESLPQYVHEYATLPIEEIMQALVKLYSKQLN